MDITFYMNHSSKNANVLHKSISKNSEFISFVTSRIIKKGEELLMNYSE